MEKTLVMVNGLSPNAGKMAYKVAEHVQASSDMELLPFSLTGSNVEADRMQVGDLEIKLVKPEDRKEFIEMVSDQSFISVDYTHPNAVNENAEFYCSNRLPFVMGTTGGDRDVLEKTVVDSDNVAVIAPNMAKQIVAFQAMLEYAANTFPDAFKGYTLEIAESHQNGKADTSGTAKAMIGYFNQLGLPFTKDQIKMIRAPDEQLEMGIPENTLTGHAWHTYTLKSKEGDVLFGFTHNVNGRDIYAAGTLDGVRFLIGKLGEKGKVYSMMDVLKGATTD
ncbi:MAG: dihydrodipicolinate reductase [Candidatus Aenigmarchaeota archaeon]|nr:dihydrodipicolinate reductase [Candidatus Aenigmarchaeota archaeon]